jgi:asparagine synthase (glutamine-hydrolysing)
MDNDLVDFAMRCPVGLKLNNLSSLRQINENDISAKRSELAKKTSDGKQILRDMMKPYIPAEVVGGEKQGFSAPDATWFKGQSIELVKRTLLGEKNALIYDFLDRRVVHKLVNQHLIGERNRRLLIWSLLNIEAWLQQL